MTTADGIHGMQTRRFREKRAATNFAHKERVLDLARPHRPAPGVFWVRTSRTVGAMVSSRTRPRRTWVAAVLVLVVLATCVLAPAVAQSSDYGQVVAGKIHLGNYEYPEPVVLGPIGNGDVRAVVILLHGLGGAAQGMESIFNESPFHDVRWIFPQAPMRAVQLNFGQPEPAWYDMRNLDPDDIWNDEEGISESAEYIKQLVLQCVRGGVRANRIILGGFSQGGAVALTTAVHKLDGIKIGGVVALSTYLPMAEQYLAGTKKITSVAKQIPFFIAHGDRDPVLAFSMGKKTEAALWGMGMTRVEFHVIRYVLHFPNPKTV